MSATVYKFTALTGGTSACVDGVDGNILINNDMGFATVSGLLYIYILNDSIGGVLSVPVLIPPVVNPGNKRWVLQGLWAGTFNALTTLAESWIGPSSTAGIYFRTDKVGIGTTIPLSKLDISMGIIGGLVQTWSNTYVDETGRRNWGIRTEQSAIGDWQLAVSPSRGTAPSVAVISALNNGNVGIGKTPGYLLELNSDSAGKPGVGGLWTVVSDERLKENIIPADLDRCWEIIKSIPLKRFTWRDEVYTREQVADRSSLGWIAQDVKPLFGKAVNVVAFTKAEKIPDGEEEYEEQAFELEMVKQSSVEMIAGKPTMVTKSVEQKRMLFDAVEVVDAEGKVVMVDDKPMLHQVPRMIKKTRPKFRQEVIEDCLDLNSGQIYAAMYGALQKAMSTIESLETRIKVLEGKI